MHLETGKKSIGKSQEETFAFLSEVSNFKAIMPDSLQKFEVLDEETFRFGLSGMPEIVLKLKEKNPHNQIVLGAASDKLPFTLTANISSTGDNSSEVQLVFEGEFNAMMAMMIKTPITNFIEALSENLGNIS